MKTLWQHRIMASTLALNYGGETILGGITMALTAANQPAQVCSASRADGKIAFGGQITLGMDTDREVMLLRVSCDAPLDGSRGIELRIGNWPAFGRALASYVPDQHWTRPAWIDEPAKLPARTSFLLVGRGQSSGKYLAILPLTGGGLRGEMRLCDGQPSIVGISGRTGHAPGEFALAAVAVGDDPYELSQRIVAAGLRAMGSGRLRKDKPTPAFVDYFGWCSWNAFEKRVCREDIFLVAESWRKKNFPIGLLILDDGWQDTRPYKVSRPDGSQHEPEGLVWFRPNGKFDGLAGLIGRLRQEYGIQSFGVWHALGGYWGGVHPEGELAGQYRTFRDVNGQLQVEPQDLYRFFNDYHAALRARGVDMVKVDVQSSLEKCVREHVPIGDAARAAHEALDGSAAVHFQNGLINCMGMTSDILLQLPNSNVSRNSWDYVPNGPDNPSNMVVNNAYNAFWTGHLSLPDWDMFQSHHPYGEFHAVARAISGGPVYVTDDPGKQDVELLKKLVITGSHVLRCPRPAQVARDCLLVNPQEEPVLLKVFNTVGGTEDRADFGLLGIFNCRMTPDLQRSEEEKNHPYAFTDEQRAALKAHAKFSPADVEGLRHKHYAVYSHRDRQLRLMSTRQKSSIELRKFDWELLVMAPVIDGLAILGLIDKFNAPAAVESWAVQGKTLAARLRDGGTIGIYAARRPRKVAVDGRSIKRWSYDKASGLLSVAVRAGRPVELAVSL